jgi:hypothetical protein
MPVFDPDAPRGGSDDSKCLSMTDEHGKQFLIDSLRGTTRGFDVDSIYLEKTDKGYKWTVFELLKADTVAPEDSHPNRYWHKNSRKFLSLWALIRSLQRGGFEASLILVNYRDQASKVKVIVVKAMTDSGMESISEKTMTFDEWSRRFSSFNNSKKGTTWEILTTLAAPERKPHWITTPKPGDQPKLI